MWAHFQLYEAYDYGREVGLDTNNRYIRIRIRKILDLRMRIRIKNPLFVDIRIIRNYLAFLF